MKRTLQEKLAILSDAAKYDASCASSGTTRRDSRAGGVGSAGGSGICHAYTPDGRCISLLKILMTNFCIYCVNRVSSRVERARFTPEEVVTLTLEFYRRNYIEGLFLSSGIIRSSQIAGDLLNLTRQFFFVQNRAFAINNTDCAGPQRNVQAREILHSKSPMFADLL